MNNEILHSNSTSIVSYVIKNGIGVWYYCEIEYWMMIGWSQWGIDLSKDIVAIEEAFLAVLQKYRVERTDLETMYREVDSENQAFFLRPLVVADFDKRQFFSNYFDRLLETMVLEGWTGTFCDVLDKIPENERYWLFEVGNPG